MMNFFNNVWIIWKREFKSYFYTPLAFVFIGMFTLLMGGLFVGYLYSYLAYTQPNMMGMPQTITIDRFFEAFYAQMHVILMLIIPFFTMRLFTEESRQNTLALLMTSPIRTTELVLAKFKAAAGILMLNILITLIFPIFLYIYSAKGASSAGPDLGIVATTYVGLVLVSLSYVAFGLFWSSVTDSQLVAVIMAFATNLGFWLISMGSQGTTGPMQKIFSHMAINEHFVAFAKGTIALESVVYFLSLIGLFLFLTNRSLESRAWRS